MALPASANAANQSLTHNSTSLVPLRVNVVSDDKVNVLVDTLILDRNCWPVPLFFPLEDAVERNAEELAYMLLTDAEVQGMGRTVRHFTGRTEIWSSSLFRKIVEQLRPQLRHVAETSKMLYPKTTKRQAAHTQQGKELVGSKKLEESAIEANKNEAKKDGNPNDDETCQPKKRTKKASLIPIKLRLCVNGVRIHDDFVWDQNVPQCPIEFAQNLGKDLNLSDEAIVAIVTSIVEQLDGAVVEDTKDLDASSSETAAARKHATAAWPLEHKVHINNLGQILAIHRP